jgi:hypothetical protein
MMAAFGKNVSTVSLVLQQTVLIAVTTDIAKCFCTLK